MSDTPKILKAPADGRYEKGWCEPNPQKLKKCVDHSIRVPQKTQTRPMQGDHFARRWNRPLSKEILEKMKSPLWRARQIAMLKADMKGDDTPTIGKFFENMVKIVAIPFAAFGAGCDFDERGLKPDCDASPWYCTDAGRPDSSVPDSAVDGDVPDSTVPTDGTVTVDAEVEVDAEVPVGAPPVLTKPTLTGGPNNLVRLEWNAPQTTPSGKTRTGYEVFWSDGTNSDSRVIPNPNFRNAGIRITSPNANYTFAVRAVYDGGTSHSEWSSLLGYQTDNSCVSAYPMNEGSGNTIYDAVGTNDGTIVGADPTNNYAAAWTQGISGSSVFFNGLSTYIDTGDTFNFDSTDAFTLEMWAQRGSVGGVNALFTRADFVDVTIRGYWFGYVSTNELRFDLQGDNSSNNLLRVRTINQFNVPSTSHNIAVVYDGLMLASGVRIYVAGVEEPATIMDDSLSGTTLNNVPSRIGAGIAVGGPVQDADFLMSGSIDDLAVYSRALTPAEIINNTCAREAMNREENNDTAPLPTVCN